MRTKARELARHKWHELLPRFGVDEKFLKNKHGPCPLCGGTDRFRYDNSDGSGSYICSSCGSGEGFTLLMKLHNWSYAETAKAVEAAMAAHNIKTRMNTKSPDPEKTHELMVNLWKRSKPANDSPIVTKYLISRRVMYNNPQVMRYVEDGDSIIMLCKVTDPSGKSCQIHRTYLNKEGGKSDRKLMPGSLPAGSAIRLYDIPEDWMGVAEGIETALSASKQFGVPTWSLISANNMEQFNPPAGIKRLTIFGDNDASYTGQAAAYQLAHRIKKTGIQIAVLIPGVEGTDWNDYPLEKRL